MSETIKHIEYGTVNLGCCENLYHTTYHQLKKEIHFAISKGEIYDPKNYLNPKYPFCYRFPFPDEDHQKLFGCYEDFERGFQIAIPRYLFSEGELSIGHSNFYIRHEHKSGYSFGVNFPCPGDEKTAIPFQDLQNVKRAFVVEIVQQKIVDNQLATIARCPFCGNKSRMTEQEIQIMHRIIHSGKTYYNDLTKQVIDIALQGYSEFTHPPQK